MAEKSIAEKMINWIHPTVEVQTTLSLGEVSFNLMSDNTVGVLIQQVPYFRFHSYGIFDNQQKVSTKDCKRTSYTISATDTGYLCTITYQKKDLSFIQQFIVEQNQPYFQLALTIESQQRELKSNYLVPMETIYPDQYTHPLFTDLDSQLIQVPYDNDMWVHYQSTYPFSGLTSYDLSALYHPDRQNGIIFGAVDFDFWKNGLVCSEQDARVYRLVSGIADAGTHDQLPHGYQFGHQLSSSRFMIGYYDQIKDGLCQYGKLVSANPCLKHDYPVVFGYNSYSGLAETTSIEHILEAGRFLKNELTNFADEQNVTYINFDATFGLNKNKIKKAIHTLHANHQKVGTYLAPFIHMDIMNSLPIKGSLFKFRKDLVLKKPDGPSYQPIDSKLPIDITIPEAEKDLRLRLREIIELGFDYLKLDFLSHGALEGVRYNKAIRTGRQALNYFYQILQEELKDQNIFVSLAISPLFPTYGHARRISCDCFGHHQDVKYLLNALNYSFWMHQNLYPFLDGDHIVLYQSKVDGQPISSINEARSRYLGSIITGGLMLLSEDFGKTANEAVDTKNRVKMIANHSRLNQLVSKHQAFYPLKLSNDNTIYYLHAQEGTYLAVFNCHNEIKNFTIDPTLIGTKSEGVAENLLTDKHYHYHQKITIQLDCYDSIIILLTE